MNRRSFLLSAAAAVALPATSMAMNDPAPLQHGWFNAEGKWVEWTDAFHIDLWNTYNIDAYNMFENINGTALYVESFRYQYKPKLKMFRYMTNSPKDFKRIVEACPQPLVYVDMETGQMGYGDYLSLTSWTPAS